MLEEKGLGNSTILAIVLRSDKTHLTNFSGDKKMHPLYLSLGNIHKSVRNKPTKRAWILLANLLISKFLSQEFHDTHLADKSKGMPGLLQKILYHTCLHIILKPLHKYSGLECPIVPISLLDAHGMIQPCIPMLMAWITDLEEVLDLLGLW